MTHPPYPTGYLEQALPYLYACERMGLQLCFSGRRRVLVTKRALRLDDAPRGLAHPPGERVTRLVQLTVTCFRATLVHVEDAMETQNITLSLPKEVLLKVKLLAVKRQTSVSGLLAQTLERLVQQEDAYAHARQRHLQSLEQGIDLGTGGQIQTRRDELHERA